jgi:3-phenylpropionate/trans-cinnamate dioxygenase ferredoxin subunit
MTTFYDAFAASDLAENTSKAMKINNKDILFCKSNDRYFAIDNMCTHQFATLEGGRLRNCFIACPLHGVRFNLETGKPLGQMTNVPVKTYELRIADNGLLQVAL